MIKVVNILADGTVMGSMEGFCPPPDAECWKTLREITERRRAAAGQQDREQVTTGGER